LTPSTRTPYSGLAAPSAIVKDMRLAFAIDPATNAGMGRSPAVPMMLMTTPLQRALIFSR